MNQKESTLKQTESMVKRVFDHESSGHDWWHIHRVRTMALHIAHSEGGNTFLIEMASLLHDLDDWKLADIEKPGIQDWLNECEMKADDRDQIMEIVEQVSFKGAGIRTVPKSLEGKIVQDADRLDAMGAIGIARTFAYGGSKGRLIYHPGQAPELHADFKSYKNSKGPTINHFYEKLLLLKERMNTKTGKLLANKRHDFMESYLRQFFDEFKANA